MRNNAGNAGRGAVAIAVLIAPSIACHMIWQTNGLNGQKRGLGLVVSKRDPHLHPHEETDSFHIYISVCVCQPVLERADDFYCFNNTISP